jgi:nucleotide-binding universal stress UspA family protein
MTTTKILVGVDGSDHAHRAVEWCAKYAPKLDAEVVVVHVVDLPTYAAAGAPYVWLPVMEPEEREKLRDVVQRDWCKPLADAGVSHRVVLMEGSPTRALMEAAESEDVALVVTGRRGRGGFAELVLGSTSHALSHHLGRPLVIVP